MKSLSKVRSLSGESLRELSRIAKGRTKYAVGATFEETMVDELP
jgi:hypothetical protein